MTLAVLKFVKYNIYKYKKWKKINNETKVINDSSVVFNGNILQPVVIWIDPDPKAKYY